MLVLMLVLVPVTLASRCSNRAASSRPPMSSVGNKTSVRIRLLQWRATLTAMSSGRTS